jgi:UDPglucose 6-dehydrogenase
MKRTCVIVPTVNRPILLKRAVSSIASQSSSPNRVVMVIEVTRQEHETLLEEFSNLNIEVLVNNHEDNLSGYINTALDHIKDSVKDLADWYLAFLDDDDWWEPHYLGECLKMAHKENAPWVVSGLIRHDDSNDCGIPLPIPQTITAGDFLVTNPNVQGSNLYVRLDKLIEIDGFDESLPSTTDRDVCIRLLDHGVSYSILNSHLVHHDASPREDRLSYPGSARKVHGLSTFFNKYRRRMTLEQQRSFKERAKNLFRTDIHINGSEDVA